MWKSPRLKFTQPLPAARTAVPAACSGDSNPLFPYTFVIVKVPLVAQLVVPDAVQLPLIVFPFTVPVRTNESLEGAPADRLSWKLPLTLPLKFPLRTNEAVSVVAVNEQELVVKFKFVTVTVEPLLAAVSEVVKANTGTPLASCRAAVQLPLMLPELRLEEPQPARVIAATRRIATANCFIRKLLWEIFRRHLSVPGTRFRIYFKPSAFTFSTNF
jgi:hypothetical protein